MPFAPCRPSLFALLLLVPLAGCSRFDLLNATVLQSGYTAQRDIAYGDLPRQKLDVFQPKENASNADIVVFIYGGSWQSGDKGDYRFVAQALASRGFITIIPDYRLYPDVTFPAFVEDAALALKWTADHAKPLPDGGQRKIFLMGHSAGAQIAALLALDDQYLNSVGLSPSALAGVALLSGPYDFQPTGEIRNVFANGEFLPIKFAKPATLNSATPPILLIQGTADGVVAPENATKLAAKLNDSDVPVKVRLYEDKGHVAPLLALAWPFRSLAPSLDDLTAFFRSVAKAPPTQE